MAAGQIKAPIIIALKNPHSLKTKNLTTETKLEIISESQDVDIYFTVNGEKPEQTKMTKSTFKYNVPFTLPAGKRVVKAVAISNDGVRESNVVTKVFEIDFIEKHDNSSNKSQLDVYGFLDELQDSKGNFESNIKNDENNRQEKHSKYLTPHCLESITKREIKASDLSREHDVQVNNNQDQNYSNKHAKRVVGDTYSRSLRLQRETDFLKCVYCLAPRPFDIQAKFCNTCGHIVPPLPQSISPLPENGQLGICIYCKSTVPMNVSNCLVCESPLNMPNQSQVTLRLGEKLVCTICGSGNPPNLDTCLTCESKLPEIGKAINMLHSQPVRIYNEDSLKNNDSLMPCATCGRKNVIEARFCDWCGVKQLNQDNFSSHLTTFILCSTCKANNESSAIYCCQCGSKIKPPLRNNLNLGNQCNQMTIPLYVRQINEIHKPQDFNSPYVSKCSHNDVTTQTVGLFFPSTAQLKKYDDEKQNQLVNNATWEKPVSLSLVSPGKGFWRKQTDHVIAHLKAYASNTSEFQAMIGEPRMGKLISANVHEEDFELSLTLNFALKGHKDPYQNITPEDSDKRFLNSMLKRSGSFDSFKSDSTVNGIRKLGISKTKTNSASRSAKIKPQSKKTDKTSVSQISDSDRDLLKKISKSGEITESEIEMLIEEGANPNAQSRKGIPVIIVAARNKHIDAVRVLKKFGADINAIDDKTGNTSLHEAVLMGSLNEDMVKTILEFGASTKIKNHKGETAYDIAVKMKNDTAIKCLSSNIGRNQVEKLIQPKQSDNFEDGKI